MPVAKSIKIIEVEQILHNLTRELMTWDEPIPGFSTRYPGVLESCLVVPFQKFGEKFLYEGFIERAAILFYLLIKNHPFRNGNKRIAMTTLFYFLHKNGRWIVVDNQELYNFAKWVAESNPKLKDATIEGTRTFLKNYLVDLSEPHITKFPKELMR